METIVLEVPTDFAQQFNELSVAKKKYYADAFKRLFFNENRIEKERLNGDVAISNLLNEIDQTPSELVKISNFSDEMLKERRLMIMNRSEEEHQRAVKKLLKTIETIGLRAEERGMTEENFNDILKEALTYES